MNQTISKQNFKISDNIIYLGGLACLLLLKVDFSTKIRFHHLSLPGNSHFKYLELKLYFHYISFRLANPFSSSQ